MPALKPYYNIEYNSKDVTTDVTPFVLSVNYTDRVSGQSDEIEVVFDDTDGRWSNQWYPAKGDRLVVRMGYENDHFGCGTFIVDEFEFSGPPDQFSIRGIATGANRSVRTKKSTAHESKSLKQIARAVAQALGLTLVWDAKDIQLERSTQYQETDLGFLNRIANDYGMAFSIRDDRMTFYSLYDLEAAAPVLQLSRADVSRVSVRVKTVGTASKAKVVHHNQKTGKVVQREYQGDGASNSDGIPFEQIVAADEHVVHSRTENVAQADMKAKAAYHRANSREVTGTLTAFGSPRLLAGVNFELIGYGEMSAKYHITESSHSISRDAGYTVGLSFKKVGTVTPAQKRRADEYAPVPQTIIEEL